VVQVSVIKGIKDRVLSRAASRYPSIARALAGAYKPLELGDPPWTSPEKPLCDSRIAVVTTAGVHHRDQEPFGMKDPLGDPTFRVIDLATPLEGLMITHDYYDHADADRDINVVFPVERLRELKDEGLIGEVSNINMGFMGHITGPHIDTLLKETAPEAAHILKGEGVDAVLLTPG
jgi:D-proline reductase (dithiol) PrdB